MKKKARGLNDSKGDGLTRRTDHACKSCGATGLSVFYECKQSPVHSILLMTTRDEAVNYPKGEVALAFCGSCGFISNIAYRPELQDYSPRCEESQGFSETFNKFSRDLAKRLIAKYQITDKEIIEIGCGKGEFLNLLCELGGNRGLGFDPAYVKNRQSSPDGVNFINDFYSEKYALMKADFVVCKMTLEHIERPADFIRSIRSSLAGRPETVVFFQVPDATRVLYELAFWDIYYEHCSYFSTGSISKLFTDSGFEVMDISRDYEGQYIMLEARASGGVTKEKTIEDAGNLAFAVKYFTENCNQKISIWKRKLRDFHATGYRIVLWGSGSKAVAFLTTLNISEEIKYVVDINPHRHGTFIAGTGQEIVPPDFLKTYKPDAVIAMNPVYKDEIQGDIDRMGLEAVLMTM
ncbi:MAG: methyltransferase domain-containing protein [Deltaproteobacteria bacterium]|nr:methyltransferase domain-containing protein [Deltaproteobacteria bacterium]